jgi:hypothetical protein
MMKKMVLLLVLVPFLFVGCSEDEPEPVINWEILVLDEMGAVVKNCAVELYKNFDDWNYSQNKVEKDFTNSNGIVRFEDLKAHEYYVYAHKNDKNNINGAVIFDILKKQDYNSTIIIE